SMVRDATGRGARRGTAVRAGVGRSLESGVLFIGQRGRDERHAGERRGERRLVDVRAQLLEQPLLPAQNDQYDERQAPGRAGRVYARLDHAGSFETTPIVVNGTMYITSPATPNNIVRAFDLRTQKMLWEYTHKNGPV